MSIPIRKLLSPWLAALAVGLARGAEPAYDMYLCANVSGQGQVMGSRAATNKSGVYRSTDRQNFEHLGPNHIRIYTLTSDPHKASAIYLGALDGVLRTFDSGVSFRRMTSWDMTEPHSVAFDPNTSDDIYISLPDGIGVSRDHGQTWKRSNEGIHRAFTQIIAVDRTKAGRVLAGTELGIYLTEDGAKTWRLVQATDKTTYDIRQSPHDPKVFLAVTSVNGVFRSEDAGRTWKPVPGIPASHTIHNCDFDRSDAKRLVVAGWGLGVQVSEDGGRTWIDRTTNLPNNEIWRVSTDPDRPGRLYAAPHLSPVHVSDDFGLTWRPLCFEKAIIYDIVFVPRH